MVSERRLGSLDGARRGTMNLSFAGCGFLGMYHVGVCTCIKEYAPQLFADKISGCSAGGLAACALLTDCCLGECTTYILGVALRARSRALGPFHPNFDIVGYIREGLDKFLPRNAHEIATGRLHISLTKLSTRENVLVSQFDTREDLIQALICSTFIPLYCGVFPPKYKGERHVDGGLSDNNPILDENTVTVSPWAGESDICPDDNSASMFSFSFGGTNIQMNSTNLNRFSNALFPPSPEDLSDLCQQGFNDALKFLQQNKLIGCAQHLSVQSEICSSAMNLEALDVIDAEEHSVTLANKRMSFYVGDAPPDSDTSSEECVLHMETAEKWEDSRWESEGDGEESEEEEEHVCTECTQRRHLALIDDMPPTVVSAMQAACDSVNKSMLAPIYRLRVFNILSLMAAPWLLPLDLMLVLAKKIYELAPVLPTDVLRELQTSIHALILRIQAGRHKYSARFTCQLAITDVDFEDEAQRGGKAATAFPQHSQLQNVCERERRASGHRHRNLNLGFAVDFHSHHRSPLQCVSDIRHQLLDDESHLPVPDYRHGAVEHRRMSTEMEHRRMSTEMEHRRMSTEMEHRRMSTEMVSPSTEHQRHRSSSCGSHQHVRGSDTDLNQESYDTFDNCLHIANQMDALLSFYYTEEDNPNKIQVREIYPLKHPSGPLSPPSPSELAWDNYMEVKHEEPTPSTSDDTPKRIPTLRRCQTELPGNFPLGDCSENMDTADLEQSTRCSPMWLYHTESS